MKRTKERPPLPVPPSRPKGAPAALAGIRILDFTRQMSGPVTTMLLADMGADVIKVENPQFGDDTRVLGVAAAPGQGSVFLWSNRNKRSIALDLRHPEGHLIARQLALQADVVVENFSTGVMDRLGLSYEALSDDNPRLIYCAISAFGREGAYAGRPGYDQIFQAESGFMSLNGKPDEDPVKAGAPVMDASTGVMACNAILGALFARERLGSGQYVEVAMIDDAIFMTGHWAMNYLLTGADQIRSGNDSRSSEPTGLFQASNGKFYLTCANNSIFNKLVKDVINRPDLADHPDFKDNALRCRNRIALHETLDAAFVLDSRESWVKRGLAAGVPIGLVRSIAEALDSQEVESRQLLSEIPHPTAGVVPNIAPPFRFSGTPVVDPVAAPLLGQHTRIILKEMLGYDDDKIGELAKLGVFGTTTP